jgi:hypothetical protein
MPTLRAFDYAIVRVTPRVERDEFVNVGAILHCVTSRYLGAAIDVDARLLATLAPDLDLDELARHLALIPRICSGGPDAGPIGMLSQTERFHWLTSPSSTVVQTSAVHSGMCIDPEAMLAHIIATVVRR